MKVKLAKIISPEFKNSFLKFLQTLLPVQTAYKVQGVHAQIVKHWQFYDAEKMKLLLIHGAKDKKGQLKIDDKTKPLNQQNYVLKNAKEYHKAYSDLIECEVDIEGISLELVQNIELSTLDLNWLLGTVIETP